MIALQFVRRRAEPEAARAAVEAFALPLKSLPKRGMYPSPILSTELALLGEWRLVIETLNTLQDPKFKKEYGSNNQYMMTSIRTRGPSVPRKMLRDTFVFIPKSVSDSIPEAIKSE